MMCVRSIWSKLLSLVLAVALVVAVLVVPASAASLEGNVTWSFSYSVDSGNSWYGENGTITIPRSGITNSSILSYSKLGNYLHIRPSSLYYKDGLLSGAIGIYMSLYGVSGYSAVSYPDAWTSENDWEAFYIDHTGGIIGEPVELTTFEPYVSAGYYPTDGVSLSFKMKIPDGLSISQIGFRFVNDTKYVRARVPSYDVSDAFWVYVPSFSVVAAESSADLDALENMADQIAQQNDLLQSMYGDIMSLLQSIYTNTGDMEAALNLANQYLQTMSGYLQGILGNTSSIYQIMSTYMHYLQNIAETSEDIYSELQTFHSDFLAKIAELIGVIQNESDDIQATMESIYQRLIAWLDEQFSGAADPDLSGNSQTVSGNIQQSDAISSQFTGSMSSQFSSLNLGSFTFGTGIISALTFVSSLWMSFYENAGEYQIIILLPMYIGISLLVSGMARKLVNRGGGGKHD